MRDRAFAGTDINRSNQACTYATASAESWFITPIVDQGRSNYNRYVAMGRARRFYRP